MTGSVWHVSTWDWVSGHEGRLAGAVCSVINQRKEEMGGGGTRGGGHQGRLVVVIGQGVKIKILCSQSTLLSPSAVEHDMIQKKVKEKRAGKSEAAGQSHVFFVFFLL